MKKPLRLVLLVSALFFGLGRSSDTQTKPEQAQREQEKNRPKIIALESGEPGALAYDGGTVRFLVSGEDTGGAWSLVELTEPPGTKTTWHRHNHSDQAYYVLEGVFTVKVGDKTYELTAGSYIFIPRGTPHGQGNLGKIPVKVLLTCTPGGFERYFAYRVELFKEVRPGHPDYMRRMTEIRRKVDVEVLGSWDVLK
jgi:quercetin dioxygenase-like cupin family protein